MGVGPRRTLSSAQSIGRMELVINFKSGQQHPAEFSHLILTVADWNEGLSNGLPTGRLRINPCPIVQCRIAKTGNIDSISARC